MQLDPFRSGRSRGGAPGACGKTYALGRCGVHLPSCKDGSTDEWQYCFKNEKHSHKLHRTAQTFLEISHEAKEARKRTAAKIKT